MNEYLKKIYKNRYLIIALVRQDMLSRYRRSILGLLWSVLMPLGISLIIGGVYTILWQSDITLFLPFLFSGLTAWNYISESMNSGTNAYIGAEGYIKQLPVDIEIFPVRTACSAMVNLGFGILAYYLMLMIVNPIMITLNTFLLIPALMIFVVFGIGIATISATVQVFVRDYSPMQSLFLQALFYVTPIVYNPSLLKEKGFQLVYELNPFYYFLQIVRDALIGDQFHLSTWLTAFAISLISIFIATYLSRKTRQKIVFKL